MNVFLQISNERAPNMTLWTKFAAICLSAMVAGQAMAENTNIEITDAYVRSTNPKVAAAFMTIANLSDEQDHLIGVKADFAARAELHTHLEQSGVMRMVHVEEGFVVPAHGTLSLERGGKHVMLMGLSAPIKTGDVVSITLVFEQAGDVVLDVPLDNDRAAKHSGH